MRTNNLILLSTLLLLGGGGFCQALADEAAPAGQGDSAATDQGGSGGGRWAGQGGGGRRRGGWQGRGDGAGGGGGWQSRGRGGGVSGGRGFGGGIGQGMQDIEKISSLTQQQKDKIHAIFEALKQETQADRQELRTMFNLAGGRRGGRRGGGGGGDGEGGTPVANGAGAEASKGKGSGNQDVPAAAAGGGGGANGARMKELREGIKGKREAAWAKVQTILTADQKKELEQIRQGQQPASNLQVKGADSSEDGN